MKKVFKRCFQSFYVFVFLISCQNISSDKKTADKSFLASDDGLLDLSLSTLEEQNVDKARAKNFLMEARRKRTIVEPEAIKGLNERSDINLALCARQTFNAVGEKIYHRNPTKKKKQDPCLRFISAEDAQRFFLEKHGPEKDFWNLDPDGDGFACKWSPYKFRKLIVN